MPSRFGSTSIAVAGQITAGTTEKLSPIIAVEIHRLQWVAPRMQKVSGISAAPSVSSIARRPNRSAIRPNTGVAKIAAKNTQLLTSPASAQA